MTARPHLTLSHRSARRVGVTLLAVVALAGTAAAPASAHGKGHGHGHGSSKAPVRVAAGLDNPRQLSAGPGGLVLVPLVSMLTGHELGHDRPPDGCGKTRL